MPKVPKVKLKRLQGNKSGSPLYRVDMAEDTEKTNMECDNPSPPQLQVITIPTTNYFNPLQTAPTNNDNGAGISANANSTVNATPSGVYKGPAVAKPKTFIIEPTEFTKLANLKSIAGKYNIQRLVNGSIKLFPSSTQAELFMASEMDKNSIYYTDQSNIKLHKYVLYGLSVVEPKLINEEITKVTNGRIVPTASCQMTIKKPKYDGQCNYIVYFAQNPTLQTLANLAGILFGREVVTWRHYINRHAGTGQCTNCHNFGHSKMSCHKPPVCGVCAQNHPTSSCPLLVEKRKNNKAYLDPSLLKCAGCGGHHTASYTRCPKNPNPPPDEYQPQQNQQHPVQPVPRPKPAPVVAPYSYQAYPELSLQNSRNKRTLSQVQQHRPLAYTQQHQHHQPVSQNNNDLFTIEEIPLIMGEIFNKLKGCTTKEQQLTIMISLAAKYIYGP